MQGLVQRTGSAGAGLSDLATEPGGHSLLHGPVLSSRQELDQRTGSAGAGLSYSATEPGGRSLLHEAVSLTRQGLVQRTGSAGAGLTDSATELGGRSLLQEPVGQPGTVYEDIPLKGNLVKKLGISVQVVKPGAHTSKASVGAPKRTDAEDTPTVWNGVGGPAHTSRSPGAYSSLLVEAVIKNQYQNQDIQGQSAETFRTLLAEQEDADEALMTRSQHNLLCAGDVGANLFLPCWGGPQTLGGLNHRPGALTVHVPLNTWEKGGCQDPNCQFHQGRLDQDFG